MPEKLFTIVGGVNGAGKSTLIARLCEKPNDLGQIIDPDRLAAEYGSIIAGGRAALKEMKRCISIGENFTEETTLSGKHVAETIAKAKVHGYKVRLLYIGLDSADDCIARVADRVRKGGHYISDDIIRRRFAARYEALERVLPLCDCAEFYDNMTEFRLVAVCTEKKLRRVSEKCPAWMAGFLD